MNIVRRSSSYQGRLTDSGGPANGNYDFRFTIFDSAAAGNAAAGPATNAATPVEAGLFTVTPDFGAGVFDGSARWLEIAVRTIHEGGVALAAIQGLDQKLEAERRALRDELRGRDARIEILEQSVAELKEVVSQPIAKPPQGER